LKNNNFNNKIFRKYLEIKAIFGEGLFNKLFVDGIHLVTKLRKNMKKKAFDIMDKVHLKKEQS
jgi:hypothetical protein